MAVHSTGSRYCHYCVKGLRVVFLLAQVWFVIEPAVSYNNKNHVVRFCSQWLTISWRLYVLVVLLLAQVKIFHAVRFCSRWSQVWFNAVGFIRLVDTDFDKIAYPHPLEFTRIHPERYGTAVEVCNLLYPHHYRFRNHWGTDESSNVHCK